MEIKTVYLYGNITNKKIMELIKEINEWLAEVGEKKTINGMMLWIYINSKWWEVNAWLWFCDYINELKHIIQIETYAIWNCHSIAHLIFSAWSHRNAYKSTEFYIHLPYFQNSWWNEKEIEDDIKRLKNYKEKMLNYYVTSYNKSKLKKEEVEKLLEQWYWHNSDEAIKLWFADKLI